MICAFNIEQRKVFKGNGEVEGGGGGEKGGVSIGFGGELRIKMRAKGDY